MKDLDVQFNVEVLAVVNPFSPSAWFKTVSKYKTNDIKTTNNRIHKQGRRQAMKSKWLSHASESEV